MGGMLTPTSLKNSNGAQAVEETVEWTISAPFLLDTLQWFQPFWIWTISNFSNHHRWSLSYIFEHTDWQTERGEIL